MNPVREEHVDVFISHKHQDANIARLFSTNLELYGAGRVRCFVSGDTISYGSDWFDQIRRSLERTKVLLFIFTSTDQKWDWCLYEVGLATNLRNLDDCRVITIHRPGSDLPDPIKHIQSVVASEEGIRNFLVKFLCTSELTNIEPPINPGFSKNRDVQDRIAREISQCFGVNPWENCFTNFLWIVVEAGTLETERIPEDARIDPESSALRMFGLTDRPPQGSFWTWRDLLRRANTDEDEKWVRDLGERFYWASRGDILKSTKSIFRCRDTSRVHRPLLHRVKLRADGSMLFEVIFVQHFELDES